MGRGHQQGAHFQRGEGGGGTNRQHYTTDQGTVSSISGCNEHFEFQLSATQISLF